MTFDKDQYRMQRAVEQEFREQWYEWRAKAEEMYGKGFLFANKQFFTQQAFREYLSALSEQQAAEETTQLLEAPAPLEVESLEVKNTDFDPTTIQL